MLPLTGLMFIQNQKNILSNEFNKVCKGLKTILETIHTHIGLIILLPFDVAVGDVIDTGIKKCNESGDFVFEHYYVTNGELPSPAEIENFI